MVKYGKTVSDKLNLLVVTLLNSFPRTLRKEHTGIERTISRFKPAFEGMIICADGTEFVLVDEESFYIVTPECESWMWNYLKPEEGDMFLDVGAHVGKYALQVAKIVGEKGLVIAIEALPENYEALTRNIRLNNLGNAIALNIAAWNGERNLTLFIGDKHGHNSIKHDMGLGDVEVEAKPLDVVLEKLNVSQVDWIKIDVEGAEYEVLQGLKNTLRNSAKVVAEVWNENKDIILTFMKKLDYGNLPIIDSKTETACYYYFAKELNDLN